jgi:hypothetical protein
MVLDAKAARARDFDLPLFDVGIVELLDMPALHANDVVVMASGALQLEDSLAAFEVVAYQESRLLELREHAVDRREAGIGAFLQERLVYVLCRKMADLALLENLEDAQARQGRFETDGFQV